MFVPAMIAYVFELVVPFRLHFHPPWMLCCDRCIESGGAIHSMDERMSAMRIEIIDEKNLDLFG